MILDMNDEEDDFRKGKYWLLYLGDQGVRDFYN